MRLMKDTPTSYTDTMTETTHDDYSDQYDGCAKSTGNQWSYGEDHDKTKENFDSKVTHTWSSSAAESITGTQTGTGDATASELHQSYDPTNDSSYSYEDHYQFNGTLDDSRSTKTNHVHGSYYNSTDPVPTDSYAPPASTYTDPADNPGFEQGTADNGHGYPFTGVASGGGFSDNYWQTLPPSSGGASSSSQTPWNKGVTKAVPMAYDSSEPPQAQHDGPSWTAGTALDPNFNPMALHRGSSFYGGTFGGAPQGQPPVPQVNRDRGWGLPSWSDYWHYLWNPSQMDKDLQKAQQTGNSGDTIHNS